MAIFIFLIFSCPSENFSLSAGVSTFPGDLFGYAICASYHLKIFEGLSTSTTFGYAKSNYDSSLGTNILDCEFSRLYLSQSVEKKAFGNVSLFCGVSLNSLKNWVIETNRIGSFRITDYYALNDFAPGLSTGIGFYLGRIKLRIIYDLLFINERGENIYYKRGNIQSLSLKLGYLILNPL